MKLKQFEGMRTFLWLWSGQALSLFGTAMTRFAVTIWAYEQTHQATALALVGLVNTATYVLFSPFGGALADRFNRKRVMALADLAAGLVTAGLLALNLTGRLQVWHLYLAGGLSSLFGSFQEPAFTASIALLVPDRQLTRANGLLSLAGDGARMAAPMLAGALLAVIGVSGIMALDLATCLAAVGVLLFLRIQQPKAAPTGRAVGRRFWHEVAYGFGYIRRHPGLRGLLLIHTGVNLFASLTYFGVLPAMILARSGGSEVALGAVQSVLGVGGVLGGLLLSLWGGPRDRVRSYLVATAASFLLGDFLFASGRGLPAWIAAAFFSAVFIPFIVSCYGAIWQRRVPAEVQGRVIAARNTLQMAGMPLGYLCGGLLADRLFEPAMASGGPLAGSLGWLVGTGPGAGMAAMFLCTCLFGLLTGLSGFLSPAVLRAERSEPLPVEGLAEAD